jgi:hypothetical protein
MPLIKRLIFSLVLLLAPLARATDINATITDSNGTNWSNGTWSAELYSPNGAPFINDDPVSPTYYSGVLDGSGSFTQAGVASNTSITPVGSQWRFTICPNASAPCSAILVTITGSTQNISSVLNAGLSLPKTSATNIAYTYGDGDISQEPKPGGLYFDVVDKIIKYWDGDDFQPVGAGSSSETINPEKEFGAIVDAQKANDCTVTASSTTVTCSSAHFTSADAGKTIGIPYAGPNNGTLVNTGTLVTTISSVTDSQTIVLADAPSTTISGPRTLTDLGCAKTSGPGNCTSASAAFTQGDVGKKITIPGIGIPGSSFYGNNQPTEIAKITSSTQIIIQRPSFASVSNQTVTIPGAVIIWGHDDTTALQNAINSGCLTHRVVLLNSGKSLTTAALVPCDGMTIVGQSTSMSTISPVGSGFSAFQNAGTVADPNENITYKNLELDLSGVRSNTYTAVNKAIFTTFNPNILIQNTYIHDCAATCIGTDFNPGGRFIDNIVSYGGDQVAQFGAGGGGACIGLGTGNYPTEDQIVSHNLVSDCGAHGIFVESQTSGTLSTGIVISNNYVGNSGWGTSVGNGIADDATRGTVTSGNFVEYSQVGITLYSGFVQGLYSADYNITGNTLIGNGRGVSITAGTGGGRVTNNEIVGITSLGITGYAPGGVAITPTTQSTSGGAQILIANNNMHGLANPIMTLASSTSTLQELDIIGNNIWNTSSQTTSHAALESAIPGIANLTFNNNSIYNLSGTSLTYGIQNSASGVITRLYTSGNDVTRTVNNQLLNNLGTVTTQVGGFTGTCASPTSVVITDGIITGCS